MKDQFLKLAGVKSDKEFYKLFPDEKSFMAKYGKQVKKLQMGSSIPNNPLAQVGTFTGGEKNIYNPVNYQDIYDDVDYSVTGSNRQMRDEQASLAAQQEMAKNSNKKNGLFDMLGQFAGGLDALSGEGGGEGIASVIGGMRYGGHIQKAENGFMQSLQNFGNKTEAFGQKVGQGYDKVDASLGKIGGVAGGLGAIGDITQGIQMMKAEKNQRNLAEQSYDLSNLTRQASQLQPEITQRNYSRPESYINYNNQQRGVGTNVLARSGANVPKAMFGMDKMAGQAGNQFGSLLFGGKGQPTGAGQVGSAVLGTVGSFIPVPFAKEILSGLGGFFGSAIGAGRKRDTDRYNTRTRANLLGETLEQSAKGVMNQYSQFAEYGTSVPNNVTNYKLGDINVKSGGYIKPISYNPNASGPGVVSEIKGQSHDEYNPRLGHTGVIIDASGTDIEAERGETIEEFQDGGEIGNNKSTVISGNLVFKNLNNILGSEFDVYKNRKIKDIRKEIAYKDAKLNKLEKKNKIKLDTLNPVTSFDKITEAALKANETGIKFQYKKNKDDVDTLLAYQDSINKTAEETGFDADSLAKGKVKVDKKAKAQLARFGKNVLKAKDGINELTVPDDFSIDMNEVEMPTFDVDREAGLAEALESYKNKKFVDRYPEIKSRNNDGIMTAINQLYPFLRPSDAEAIDPNQFAGENFALASNQEDGVPVQTFQPELAQYMNVSLQDQINAVTAQTRAAQRMAQNNPAALSMINAQAYDAINSIKANEFRMNQEEMKGTLSENRQLLNQARLQNIGAYDQQSEKQLQGRALTKAVKQAALNSIASKYAQNKLENRTLATYENMYNFRFDDKGRAINMNPLQQFNTDVMGNVTLAQLEEEVDKRKKDQKEKEKETGFGRNGAILKAFRS